MLFILSSFFIIIGLIKKDSKILFYLLLLFLLLLLLGGNTSNPDRLTYINYYMNIANGVSDSRFEYGFQILCKISSALGMSYDQFLFIVTFIGLALIASTIKLYTSNISYVLVLYFIYPFIWDTVQIRNFFAMSIIIYGSRYIISYQKEYVKYIICLMIASSIHITALFYVSLLLVAIKSTRKMFIGVTIISVASILLMPKILQYSLLFISVEKIEAYYMTQTSLITKAAVIVYFVLSIILVIISTNIMTKGNLKENSTKSILEKSYSKKGTLYLQLNQSKIKQIDPETILKINIICMLFIYFLMNNLSFFRLYRNIFVINYILFALCLSKIKKTSMYYAFFWCVFIFVVISFFYLIIYAPGTNIIDPVFYNNAIFDWVKSVF
jgi:hypothetical protein